MLIESSKSTKGALSEYIGFDRLKASFFPCGGPEETGKWHNNKQARIENSEKRPHPRIEFGIELPTQEANKEHFGDEHEEIQRSYKP